jgi:hypothetical protein
VQHHKDPLAVDWLSHRRLRKQMPFLKDGAEAIQRPQNVFVLIFVVVKAPVVGDEPFFRLRALLIKLILGTLF